jgi:hypothetical protein
VGHIINLAVFVESVVNHHLYLLRETRRIEDHHYLSLEKAGVIPKIPFAFKDDVLSKRLAIGRLRQLVKLRNQAVHYKETSARSVGPTVEDLLGIWEEIAQLLVFAGVEPTPDEFNKEVARFVDNWVE